MEVRSEHTVLHNRTASIDSFGSGGKGRQYESAMPGTVSVGEAESEIQPVLLSISAAGMQRSRMMEQQPEKETFLDAIELGNMAKKMEGLSSQVINGHFSGPDRLNFNRELGKLSYELDRLNEDGVVVTKEACSRLSQQISDLTRVISSAAVYRNSARTVFVFQSKQEEEPHAKLNIAI